MMAMKYCSQSGKAAFQPVLSWLLQVITLCLLAHHPNAYAQVTPHENVVPQVSKSEQEIELANRVAAAVNFARASQKLPTLPRLQTLDLHPMCIRPPSYQEGHFTHSEQMRAEGHQFAYIFESDDPLLHAQEIKSVATSYERSGAPKLNLAVEVCRVHVGQVDLYRTVIAYWEKDLGICTKQETSHWCK
jgi:hypothetical protein